MGGFYTLLLRATIRKTFQRVRRQLHNLRCTQSQEA
jgi:hypothetical protein